MAFKQISSGGDRNFSYLIICEKSGLAAVTDPSPEPENILKELASYGAELKFIFNTHSHSDHTGGNQVLKSRTDASLVSFHGGTGDPHVGDGAVLNLGDISLEIIHTPGHTPDSICIKAGDNLVTGDTLFVGKVGGTYGEEDARSEFDSLKKLMMLPDHTIVWPGHDYGTSPSSTIGHEKNTNPFILRLGDFREFLWLKQNWVSFKTEHGIK